jgi:hypothetical protein
MRSLIVMTVILGTICVQIAVGQPDCEEFALSPDGSQCMRIETYQVSVGGSSSVTITATAGPELVQLGWNFDGEPFPTATVDGVDWGVAPVGGVWLSPDQAAQVALSGPDEVLGTLQVGFLSPNPEALRNASLYVGSSSSPTARGGKGGGKPPKGKPAKPPVHQR